VGTRWGWGQASATGSAPGEAVPAPALGAAWPGDSALVQEAAQAGGLYRKAPPRRAIGAKSWRHPAHPEQKRLSISSCCQHKAY